MKNNDYSVLIEGKRKQDGVNIDLQLKGIEYQEDIIYSLEAILLKFTDMINYNMIGQVFFMLTDIYDLSEAEALDFLGDYAGDFRFASMAITKNSPESA